MIIRNPGRGFEFLVSSFEYVQDVGESPKWNGELRVGGWRATKMDVKATVWVWRWE
jgi:hypothetical protein